MLNQEFKAFIRSLNDDQVRYLVVGAYAALLHGYPRRPKNLDLWIEASADNAQRLAIALKHLGIDLPEGSRGDLHTEDRIVQLQLAPNRRAILNTLNDVEFGACYEARTQKTVDDLAIDVLAAEHLRIDKTNLWTVTGMGRA